MPEMTSKTMNETERELRTLLWELHGCRAGGLYGDDGEMSCKHCGCDFKRMSPGEIRESLFRTIGASSRKRWPLAVRRVLGMALDE